VVHAAMASRTALPVSVSVRPAGSVKLGSVTKNTPYAPSRAAWGGQGFARMLSPAYRKVEEV
jgi:hypothetical protein